MIGWTDGYKVVVAMVPLYVALGLGYASVRWWRMFRPDQCDAISRFNCYIIIPFFTFHFTSSVNPYRMNYRFLAGDVIAKAIVGAALALWAILRRKDHRSWAVTSFSLATLNNTLVVGVPLLEAMYGPLGKDVVVQSFAIQALIWFTILLFMLEFRRTWQINSSHDDPEQPQRASIEIIAAASEAKHELEEDQNNTSKTGTESAISLSSSSYNLGPTMKKVWGKLAKNPNSYACAVGLIWALLAKRWDFEMPSIVEGSIMVMAKAGGGVSMFTLGLFMARQEKVIACGVQLTIYAMVLRFVIGPLTMVVGSLALGLRSNILRIAIIQDILIIFKERAGIQPVITQSRRAALPQSISSFVFAQEYGLHANVLSTAVIFGTIVSLPLLIGYYVVFDVFTN